MKPGDYVDLWYLSVWITGIILRRHPEGFIVNTNVEHIGTVFAYSSQLRPASWVKKAQAVWDRKAKRRRHRDAKKRCRESRPTGNALEPR